MSESMDLSIHAKCWTARVSGVKFDPDGLLVLTSDAGTIYVHGTFMELCTWVDDIQSALMQQHEDEKREAAQWMEENPAIPPE